MVNNVSLIPKQPARHSLLTSTENIVYMPLASKNSHGIVKVGDGLNITTDGLLSVDFSSKWYSDIKLDVDALKIDVEEVKTDLTKIGDDVINIEEKVSDVEEGRKIISIYQTKRDADNINTDLNNKIDDVINNVTKIGDENNNFATKGAIIGENSDGNSIAIGTGANARLTGSIAIGSYSRAELAGLAVGAGAKANGDNSNAFGSEAEASGLKSLALGTMARTSASLAIQLGQGNNNQSGTLQFKQYNIVGSDGKLKTNVGDANSPVMEIVATEKYVRELFNKISGGGIILEVVDTLPTEDILSNAIYLVPVENPNGNNYYEEYLYVVDKFEMIGTTAIDLSNYVTTEEYNKLVNNETLIASPSGYFKAGENAQGPGIVIGENAKGNNFTSVSIGGYAQSEGGRSVCIGYYAKSPATYNIQLGQGTNNNQYTLQIFGDNIYNHNTHTLTVQNIELNGVDLGTQLGDLNTALETILGV